MDIYINNEKIDFSLENEKYLYEVVSGLKAWAEQDGFQLQHISYDDNEYSFDSEDSANTPVESVSVLKVTAKSRFEVHQDNLQLLNQFVSLFLKSLESGNIKLIRDLCSEAPAVTPLIAAFLEEPQNAEGTVSASLLNNIKSLDPENINAADPHYSQLLQQLTGLKIIINERISELGDPVGELSKTVKALKTTGEELNDISVLLQTGKDREALGSVIKFSELNQKTLRLYPILKNEGFIDIEQLQIEEMSFSGFYNDFNEILNELLEAFTANDSVLIGDLLEYEVAPRLEKLIAVLENVLKENQ